MVDLEVLPDPLAICRFGPDEHVPDWVLNSAFYSITRTFGELSVVAPLAAAPADCQCDGPWRALMVQGPLDFDLTGIMAGLTAPLAAAGVPVFVLSTYDTDFVLVRAAQLDAAIAALTGAGYGVTR